MDGWIKLHRKTLDNPVVMKDAEHLAIWMWLLMNAAHAHYDSYHNGKRITLEPGQLTTGRKKIADELRVSESKVERVLTCFENEHQIEQQKCNKNRLITILHWDEYQEGEQQNEQQVDNKRTTTEQQLNTKQEYKELNNKYKYIVEQILDYMNSICGTNYKSTTKSTQRHIVARLNEGYTLDDFKTVILKKSREWKGTDMEKYLRPETLFGTKFENYLNQKMVTSVKPANKFHNFDERGSACDTDLVDKFNAMMGGG